MRSMKRWLGTLTGQQVTDPEPPKPSPPPFENQCLAKLTGVELEVCEDIAIRQDFGRKKYGQTVRENPLSAAEWVQHAYEECLDMAIYLRRLKLEILNVQATLHAQRKLIDRM